MPYPLGHVVFVECAVVAAVVEAATHAADLDLLLDPGGAALERHGDPRPSAFTPGRVGCSDSNYEIG